MAAFIILSALALGATGAGNRPPSFLPGGDMNKFSLSEDTPVGSVVYTLKGWDPEGSQLSYYISGGPLAVDKESGEVTLARALDREEEPVLDVIISVSDQPSSGQEPNTVSFKREISILDVNDNVPTFFNLPYDFSLPENARVGTRVYRGIFVSDPDLGANSDVELSCLDRLNPEACSKFGIRTFQVGEGRFQGEIVLREVLDFEEKRNYTMTISARDRASTNQLNATVSVFIRVGDIQDMPPVFLNEPFSATLVENTAQGVSVMEMSVQDGDRGVPRQLALSLSNDRKQYFSLSTTFLPEKNAYKAVLLTTSNPIDRENPEILSTGGIYTFQIMASEVSVEGDGMKAVANITVVVHDENDQVPQFNSRQYNVSLPEDSSVNSPVAGFSAMVQDLDVGENAKFRIELEGGQGIFSVVPSTAIGKTPLILKVIDPSQLDYENPEKRFYELKLVATQEDGRSSSTAKVLVWVEDVNDNAPQFEEDQYLFQVPENAPMGTDLFSLRAFDLDSGRYGQLTYSLKGHASEKFRVVQDTGMVQVGACCLDYETDKSYSLTYTAQDGGGKVAAVNLFIEIVDVNDNSPTFVQDEYFMELSYSTVKISPPLFVKATDADSGEAGKIVYSLQESILSPALVIDPENGRLTLAAPVPRTAPQGVYSLVVEASDRGDPPLVSTSKLVVHLEEKNSGGPLFLNLPYLATVPENALQGKSVLKVSATGSGTTYLIESGSRDSFVLEKDTGILRVASEAHLVALDEYRIQVQAIDGQLRTSSAPVLIEVHDINNAPPQFSRETYTRHISEGMKVNQEVLKLDAQDPDITADLRYALVEPFHAQDRTGAILDDSTTFDFKNAFKINETTGSITLNIPLDHSAASVIILTAQVTDTNAVGHQQIDKAEVMLYVESGSGVTAPVFSPVWSAVDVLEETRVGTALVTLTARDPVTQQPVSHYEKVPTDDPVDFVQIGPTNGAVVLSDRLDYEALKPYGNKFTVSVKAVSGQGSSTATVQFNILDINDNSPLFTENEYSANVPESARHPEVVLKVQATDRDTERGYGVVRYSVSGDGSHLLDINPVSGEIFVKAGAELDREAQELYNLVVTAYDNPDKPANQRRTSVLARIRLSDINDNDPSFNQEAYSAVIPESAMPGSSILTVRATDPDSSVNGAIRYSLSQENPAYFSVSPESGEVSVVRALAGRGRSEPYAMAVRATDGGSPGRWTEVPLDITVGDISANDGVPQFLRPTAGEVAYVSENASLHTSVFRIVAYDPDGPLRASGRIMYRFLDNRVTDFTIDAATGVVRTARHLDREARGNYTMIIVARDLGSPPQESHAVLNVLVLDVNDNAPYFNKLGTITFLLTEEVQLGSVVGHIEAHDDDIGENGKLVYHIVGGNENETFGMHDTADGKGEIFTKSRIDCEAMARYVLTIRVANEWLGENLTEPYDPSDPSMIQVFVTVEDIDDHPPVFDQPSYAIGLRVNTEIGSHVLTVHAIDPDMQPTAVQYSLQNLTFHRGHERKELPALGGVVGLHPDLGTVATHAPLWEFLHGYLELSIEAHSGADGVAATTARIHIIQDRDLMKFVFVKRPAEIRELMPQFKRDLSKALHLPQMSFNMNDPQYYSQEDGSLDFESTGSCFHLLSGNVLLDSDAALALLDSRKSAALDDLFKTYKILRVENCIPEKAAYKITWSQLSILMVACLIGVSAFVVSLAVCFMYTRYKKKLMRPTSLYPMRESNGPPIGARLTALNHQRIYDWQEMNTPLADAMSFRSYPPTLRYTES